MYFPFLRKKYSLDQGIYRKRNIISHLKIYSQRSIYVEIDNLMKHEVDMQWREVQKITQYNSTSLLEI